MVTREHRKAHDVEQTEKLIPFITSEIAFRQDVCEMVFGISVFDLDFGVHCARGVDSAGWPHIHPPGGEGQGGFSCFQSQAVISVSTEVAWNKMMEVCQARRGVVDETCCESG